MNSPEIFHLTEHRSDTNYVTHRDKRAPQNSIILICIRLSNMCMCLRIECTAPSRTIGPIRASAKFLNTTRSDPPGGMSRTPNTMKYAPLKANREHRNCNRHFYISFNSAQGMVKENKRRVVNKSLKIFGAYRSKCFEALD